MNIKSLGKIEGELFHRHFGESTFKELLKKEYLDEVLIITYISVSSAMYNLKHIVETFTGKTNKLTIMLGISWVKTKNKSTEEEELSDDLLKKYGLLLCYIKSLGNSKTKENLFNDLTIHINSRCHIKAVYADNETYFGSQNFAKTSRSFTENKHYPNLLNYHELVVRIHDKNGNQVKSLLKEILKDNLHNELVLSSGKFVRSITLQDLDARKSVKYITEEIDRLNDLKSKFDDISKIIEEHELPEIEIVQLEKQDYESLISLFEKVAESASYQGALDPLKKILATFTGEYDFISPTETDDILLDIKDRLENFLSLLEDLADQINIDLFYDISSEIEKVIESFDLFRLPKISDVLLFEEHYEPITEVLINADVNNLSAFNNTYLDEMNNLAQGSPGEVSSEFLDNDGNLVSSLAVENLPGSAIGEVHNSLSDQIGREIIELLYTPIKEHFSYWHDDLSYNLSVIESLLQDIKCSFDDESYSRIE